VEEKLKLPRGKGAIREAELVEFSANLLRIGETIGFKVSARGWCYTLEGFRLINKNQFNRVESAVNECRDKGYLPIDFVPEDAPRVFKGVEEPTEESPVGYMKRFLEGAMNCQEWYTPNWWEDEEYYIQMVVEKVDLMTLFEPVCEAYHIPIATGRGWSSKLQRALYARRFKEAEEIGLKCLLLSCGDHDPDGLRITDFLRNNLWDLRNVCFHDGYRGYNPGGQIYKNGILISDEPERLKIKRFGLNYDFIIEHNLTWIDNLITASGKNLASPSHKNFHLEYVQNYLRDVGERKCEANAIVTIPDIARELCTNVIEIYLGRGALDRFEAKRQRIRDELSDFREETDIGDPINRAIDIIEGREG